MRTVFALQNVIAGKDYRLFLRTALQRFPTFMLVWQYPCAHAIRRELRPLQLTHHRRSRWPGTVVFKDKVDIITYRFDRQAMDVLERPGSLLGWLHPDYPEDLALFGRDKNCAFGSVAHEGLAFILDVEFARALPKRFELVEESVEESDWKEFYDHVA
jgi:hypothetical protein